MFSKILIANRGEIACRVIRTARRLGIRCVAVYSEADRNARHVRLADEAIFIGPAPANESYLSHEKIIAAAIKSQAQAIHPGYGFLSENAAFAAACEQAGLVFIGPSAEAIAAMGSKSAAKALMEKAGVPMTPGYHGPEQNPDFLRRQADAIGYPILIKASSGGGGKGMRRVDRADDFLSNLEACQREAVKNFGDAQVLIEKYLLNPRHIEIQIFGDTQGHYVYLFERDCSVQRRHQKVVEEAPAPGMRADVREVMGRAAIEAAKAVSYVGAGTVEFIVGENFANDGVFYFMEMNTRLQVEHPVTEMITGFDLVEWQLCVAAGQALPVQQDDLLIVGHAIEARIYAEDPTNHFLPSIGRIHYLKLPPQSLNVRFDLGVDQGDVVSPYYDPMLGKLITWGETREEALRHMCKSLQQFNLLGLETNLIFLRRLMENAAFSAAQLDTGLIERNSEELLRQKQEMPLKVVCLACLFELVQEKDSTGLYAKDGWRLNLSAERKFEFLIAEKLYEIDVMYVLDMYCLRVADQLFQARANLIAADRLQVEINAENFDCTVFKHADQRFILIDGNTWQVELHDPLQSLHPGAELQHDGILTAPMPGKLIAILAEVDLPVVKGTPLLIVEAMKMEHTITAPAAGKVIRFNFAVGDQVREGEQLLEFSAE